MEVSGKFSEVITKRGDLSSADEREKLYEWIAADHGDLNVLVDNARIQQWVKVADEDFYQKAKVEIATNIEAPIHLSSLFLKLPSLKTIINITSGLSFVPCRRAAKETRHTINEAEFALTSLSMGFISD